MDCVCDLSTGAELHSAVDLPLGMLGVWGGAACYTALELLKCIGNLGSTTGEFVIEADG